MRTLSIDSPDDILAPQTITGVLGPFLAIESTPIDSGGFSGSTFERVTVTLAGGEQLGLILKRTSVAADWFSRRTGDCEGREARVIESAFMADVWRHFESPYLAVAARGGEIALLMRDLSLHLFPVHREAIPADREGLIVDALAGMHARYWGRDDHPPEGLMRPVHYLSIMGPGDHESDDAVVAPPIGIREWMHDGWETALGLLPEAVTAALLQPPERIWRPWSDLPQTLLHGDTKLANIAVLPDARVSIFDWAFAGWGPCTFDLGWYLAVNSSRLARSKEEFILLYRDCLQNHLGWEIDESTWERLVEAGLVCASLMLLWTKAMGVRNERAGAGPEWEWWAQHLLRWAAKA